MPYCIMKEKLYDLIVNEKKVKFHNLVSQHFSLPLDRVSRFLDMLKDEFSAGARDEIKEYFMAELTFAQEKISRQELFQTAQLEALAIDEQQSAKKIAHKHQHSCGHQNQKGRLSMRLPWLDAYSNIGADRGILSNLKKLESTPQRKLESSNSQNNGNEN